MIKLKNIETALNQFEEAATMHAQATEQGNYKTGNKCYTVISRVIKFLKEENELKKLSSFLNHPSVGVRMWSATYLLPISENEGIKVLERIVGETGIHSLTAETTLIEWRKGNLKL